MTNYERGFITKCAEYGVDPVELIKVAGPVDSILKGLGNLGSVGKMFGSSLWNIFKGTGKSVGREAASAFRLAKPQISTIGKSIAAAGNDAGKYILAGAKKHPLITGAAVGSGLFGAGYNLGNKPQSDSRSNDIYI